MCYLKTRMMVQLYLNKIYRTSQYLNKAMKTIQQAISWLLDESFPISPAQMAKSYAGDYCILVTERLHHDQFHNRMSSSDRKSRNQMHWWLLGFIFSIGKVNVKVKRYVLRLMGQNVPERSRTFDKFNQCLRVIRAYIRAEKGGTSKHNASKECIATSYYGSGMSRIIRSENFANKL